MRLRVWMEHPLLPVTMGRKKNRQKTWLEVKEMVDLAALANASQVTWMGKELI